MWCGRGRGVQASAPSPLTQANSWILSKMFGRAGEKTWERRGDVFLPRKGVICPHTSSFLRTPSSGHWLLRIKTGWVIPGAGSGGTPIQSMSFKTPSVPRPSPLTPWVSVLTWATLALQLHTVETSTGQGNVWEKPGRAGTVEGQSVSCSEGCHGTGDSSAEQRWELVPQRV